jgi:hypothetical protein
MSLFEKGTFSLDNTTKIILLEAFLTVWGVTGLERVWLMKWVASTALSSLPVVIC